jgi:hypothetical protein
MVDEELHRLEKLLGTWELDGDTSGVVTYEWMDGGYFLLQHIDMVQDGNRTKGLEVIGRLREFGSPEPSADIKSRFYGAGGETFDYVYEMSPDRTTLTIWGGEKGSPAHFTGTFNDAGDVLRGAWVYPGGGYESVMTKTT